MLRIIVAESLESDLLRRRLSLIGRSHPWASFF
jgi:hypothetical protein